MKKTLFTLVLLFTAFSSLPLTAQTDSVTTDTTVVDEIEAFSDTTQNDTSGVSSVYVDDDNFPFDDSDSFDSDDLKSLLDGVTGAQIASMLFVLFVLLIIFVVSPIAIIGLILWFIYRNRKDRIRLAEMAMKNGQPIPDEVASPLKPQTDNEVWEKGVRQTFLGIGLTVLGIWIGKLGIILGLLVLCIGLGNLFIVHNARRNSMPGEDGTRSDNERPQSRDDVFRDLQQHDGAGS